MAEATQSIKERILKISLELSLERKGKNDFQNFNYFRPDDIVLAVLPLMEKYRLFSKFDMPYNKEKEMYEAKMEISDLSESDHNLHIEAQVYQFDIPLTQVKGAGQAQNAGATATYGKRYCFMNIFNIADNNADPDNSKNKPATGESKSSTQTKLQETLAMVDVAEDIATLNKWKEGVISGKAWTDTQKRVITGRIDTRIKELKK